MLNTNRLQLRELVSKDWQAMQKIAIDFQKSEYAIYDIPLSVDEEEIKALTKQFAESHLFFAVMLGDTMIGYVCFHKENENYDLGYCVHSDYQGNGYAYEACSALMVHIAETRTVKAFTAGTALKNIPSCKLLDKLGFVLKETETLSFRKDEKGNDIIFEGGIFVKNNTVIIRKAVMNDADKIGAIHYKAWIETYTGMLPESYLATRSAEKSINLFRRNECKNIAIAEVDGEIVGFCGWGEYRDQDADERMGEIQGIYLLEAFKRNYIGQRLIKFALRHLKDSGYRKAGLWVLDANEGAIRFYEKQGFVHNGIIKEADLGEIVTELFYIKEI